MKLWSFIFSFCLTFLAFSVDIKVSQLCYDDFTESEYKIIARMINSLDYNLERDRETIQQFEIIHRIIWNAFIWRLYIGNNRDNSIYFTKLNGIEFNAITQQQHEMMLQLLQTHHYSTLVVNEYLTMAPPEKFIYPKDALNWIKKIFLNTKYPPLRKTTFYILVMTSSFDDRTNTEIFDKLSKEEKTILHQRQRKKGI